MLKTKSPLPPFAKVGEPGKEEPFDRAQDLRQKRLFTSGSGSSDKCSLPDLAHMLHHAEKSFTLFDDVPHLFDIKINKRPIISLLSIIEQPVIVLTPFHGQLLSLDIVSVKNRSNLAVLPERPSSLYQHC